MCIRDRNKGCRICEQEYLSLFPALAVSYYSNRKGLKAELGSDPVSYTHLDVYKRQVLWLPAEHTVYSSEKYEVNHGNESRIEGFSLLRGFRCRGLWKPVAVRCV